MRFAAEAGFGTVRLAAADFATGVLPATFPCFAGAGVADLRAVLFLTAFLAEVCLIIAFFAGALEAAFFAVFLIGIAFFAAFLAAGFFRVEPADGDALRAADFFAADLLVVAMRTYSGGGR